MQGAPIKIAEHFRLSQLGVNPTSFKFGVTSFESDKYISIKDTTSTGEQQLVIVELDNNFNTTRKPNKAEAAIMHPTQNIVALRAKNDTGNGSIIQIFNMDKKEKLKHVELLETVVYWRWCNTTKLAIVTTTSVYHINIANPNEQQVKILDRAGALQAENPVQIIGYNLDPTEKWCALFGISTPDGGKTINGHIQLFLIEGAKQQLLEGQCCTFGEAQVHNEEYKSLLFCFVEKKLGEVNSKLHITEVGTPPPNVQKFKKFFDLAPDPAFPSDFPVLMYICSKFGLLFVISKYSFLTVFELSSASLIYKQRICNENVFVGTGNTKTGGYFVVGKEGVVYSINVDEAQLVNYVLQQCRHIPDVVQLALKMAGRYKLPGADNIFVEQFNRLLVAGDIANAAKIAASAPGTLLRNPETIAKFKQIQQQAGQQQPLIIYFSTLLDKGKLNQIESLELCGPILQQNKKSHVENLLQQDKLQLSEQLGDMFKPYDTEMAIQVYKKTNSNQKLAQLYMETGQLELAMQLQQATGVTTDYMSMIKNIMMQSPENALNLAKTLHSRDPNINVHAIAEMFLQFNRIQEMTAFLVDCMKQNKPEDGIWQTKVLETNLIAAPQVADAILQMNQWSQFNRNKIAQLCEQKGLYQRALENYQDPKDIKRVILNTHGIDPTFLVNFLNKVDGQLALQCMQDMLRHNRQNLQIVVNVAVQNNQRLTIPACVKIFEAVSSYEGVYLFLGSLINSTNDKEIYHKYIEAATKCNQIKELERVITEKLDCYEPEYVKNFLKEQRMPDPRPLIFLCDIHNYVDELTRYLYKNSFNKYIEIYIFKVNTQATPQVLGTLIDLECDETYIKQLLYNIRGLCPIEPTIEEFEKRNKLRVLENWLDSRVAEGNQIPEIHNALAKIKIDTSQDPEDFLNNNKFYDAKVVGKFCEERDPQLAVLAYKSAWGKCDEELIALTNKNEMYRIQAKYLVERQSEDLWATVLRDDNAHRKLLIDYVIQALTDSKNVEEVSTAVQAIVKANIPQDLLGLLEKLVLHNAEFGQYKKLQNLLIITAIRNETSKVMDYINRLDNFDGPDIAEYTLKDEFKLYEEGLAIYKKFDLNVEAIDVLLNKIKNPARAHEFADKVNLPEVWSRLAQSYLNLGQIVDAIEAFIKATDNSQYLQVISVAEYEEKWEPLVKYLLMCRTTLKDVNIDNSLAFAYAKLEKNGDLEALIQGSNSADHLKVGDRVFESQLYEAAKILYVALKNNAKIASCLVKLKQFSKAIESAQKANKSKTWKELCYACVEASEFKFAAQAAQFIIIVPDLLEALIKHYEEYNAQEEMQLLLENALNMSRAHVGIYTELAILYCHYKPKRVLEHCRQYFKQMNVLKVLRTCERMCLWAEAVYMHTHYDQPDNAISIMIEHSPTAFSHDILVSLLQKVTNKDLCFKAILFYIDEQPEQLNELLRSIQQQLDLSKLVKMMKKTGYLALIAPFLQQVQNVNNREVNDALNEIYLEAEEFQLLRESVQGFENFDQVALARQTQGHDLMEFRRIAAYLYRRIQKYDLSMNLSKQDEVYRDSIETAQESQNPKLVQDLLEFFVQKGEKEFFTVCLYTCYDLLRPDTVMELSWRAGLMEFAMPFFIQVTSELTNRVETVQKKHEDREKKEEANAKKQQSEALDVAQDLNYIVPQQLMLQSGPPQQQGAYGQFPQNNSQVGSMVYGNTPQQPQFGSQQSGFGTNYNTPQGPYGY